MIGLKPVIVRPNVRVSAKKNDFVAPAEAPGEGRRRFPSMDEPENKKPHPIKKFIMNVFKIKEIDHEKFRKESMWAIKINKEDDNSHRK